MGNTKTSLLITLFSCMRIQKGAYTKASVNKQRELLEKRHGIKIGRRWLFQCVADLIGAGILSRRSRHKHESDGTIRQLSSMVAFTIKGAKYLMAMKVEGSILLLKQILAWVKNQDKRWPGEKDNIKGEVSPLTPSDAGRLADLAKMVYKPV